VKIGEPADVRAQVAMRKIPNSAEEAGCNSNIGGLYVLQQGFIAKFGRGGPEALLSY
jgi:hypothetical protein